MAICKFSDFFLSSSKSTLIVAKERLGDDKAMVEFITSSPMSRIAPGGSGRMSRRATRRSS
jgi:hypothetical protein